MRGFEVIRKEGRWRFRFIPGNNNGQPVGESKEYDSYDECLRAVKQLRGLIVENRIDTIDSPFVRVVKGERMKSSS